MTAFFFYPNSYLPDPAPSSDVNPAIIIFPDGKSFEIFFQLWVRPRQLYPGIDIRFGQFMIDQCQYTFSLVIGMHSQKVHIYNVIFQHGPQQVNEPKRK